MLLLPTFNVTIRPCLVGSAAFTGHEQGHFCGSCQRVVQDFSQSLNPISDLAAASAASPDGRVREQFQRSQTLDPHTLTRRLKWFLLALVLVVVQGLTAQEALAQVKQVAATPYNKPTAAAPQAAPTALPADENPNIVYGEMMEIMPRLRGGGSKREVIQYLQRRIVWPCEKGKIVSAEGRVFASFTVGTDGQVQNAKIVRSFNHRFNESVLLAVRTLPQFILGLQNGQPVPVTMTLPITFKLK